jgi:hypothetical protein
MGLSPDERRELGELNRILSRDAELAAVARLFAEPPGTRHRGQLGVVVAVLAAALAFASGCVVAAVGGPASVVAGTLLVLCSAAIPVTVLVRRQTAPSRAPGRCR